MSTELRAVIQLCREQGVEWVKLPNGTEIKLHAAALGKITPLAVEVRKKAEVDARGERIGQNDLDDDSLADVEMSDLSPMDRAVLRAAQLEQLMMDDPEAYEDVMISASMERSNQQEKRDLENAAKNTPN